MESGIEGTDLVLHSVLHSILLLHFFQNRILSGVVVISNDNVTPFDVTTKDDLFYQVSCDYAGTERESGRVLVTGGLVVG